MIKITKDETKKTDFVVDSNSANQTEFRGRSISKNVQNKKWYQFIKDFFKKIFCIRNQKTNQDLKITFIRSNSELNIKIQSLEIEIQKAESELKNLFDKLGDSYSKDDKVLELQEKRSSINSQLKNLEVQKNQEDIDLLSRDKNFITGFEKIIKPLKKASFIQLFSFIEDCTKKIKNKNDVVAEELIPSYEAALLGLKENNLKLYEKLSSIIKKTNIEKEDHTAHWYALQIALLKIQEDEKSKPSLT